MQTNLASLLGFSVLLASLNACKEEVSKEEDEVIEDDDDDEILQTEESEQNTDENQEADDTEDDEDEEADDEEDENEEINTEEDTVQKEHQWFCGRISIQTNALRTKTHPFVNDAPENSDGKAGKQSKQASFVFILIMKSPCDKKGQRTNPCFCRK